MCVKKGINVIIVSGLNLSCNIQLFSFSENEKLSVVSLATGTKCIGQKQMSKAGKIKNEKKNLA